MMPPLPRGHQDLIRYSAERKSFIHNKEKRMDVWWIHEHWRGCKKKKERMEHGKHSYKVKWQVMRRGGRGKESMGVKIKGLFRRKTLTVCHIQYMHSSSVLPSSPLPSVILLLPSNPTPFHLICVLRLLFLFFTEKTQPTFETWTANVLKHEIGNLETKLLAFLSFI